MKVCKMWKGCILKFQIQKTTKNSGTIENVGSKLHNLKLFLNFKLKNQKKILGTYKNVGSEVHILKVENEKKKQKNVLAFYTLWMILFWLPKSEH